MNNTQRGLSLLALVAAAGLVVGVIVSGSLRFTPATAGSGVVAGVGQPPVLAKTLTIPSFPDIAAAALPSVVTITSTGVVSEQMLGGDPFEFFFGPRPRGGEPRQRRQVAGGSGFLISDAGLVVTNNHVVANATKIQVTLNDREVYVAKLVGTDPATDVALLKIDAKHKLPAIALGDSDKLRVGEPVMAIGNPLNFNGTVTVGVISAKGRTGISDNPITASLEDFLQTDAAINFGNSGGPLINTNAEVVGINTAMIQPAQNIGFAVAINTAKNILPQLEKNGKVERGMLGIRIRPVDQDIMQAFHLPAMKGAFVESVDAGQPADRAGIKPGDAIVGVDGREVNEPRELIGYVSTKGPGQKVQLTVLREGKRLNLEATLARRSEPAPARNPIGEDRGHQERLGITVTDLTPEIRQELGVPVDVTGVIVADVREISPAAEQGLATGDVITEANGHKIKSVSDLRTEVRKVHPGDYIRLYVRRFHPQELSRFVLIKAE